MADNIDITVEGVESIIKNFQQLKPKAWKDDALKQMRSDAAVVRADMRSNAPRRKGTTANNLKTLTFVSGGSDDLLIRVSTGPRFENSSKAWYSHFTELGTPRQKPLLYIQKAGRSNYGKIVDGMLSIIQRAIDKANGNA